MYIFYKKGGGQITQYKTKQCVCGEGVRSYYFFFTKGKKMIKQYTCESKHETEARLAISVSLISAI